MLITPSHIFYYALRQIARDRIVRHLNANANALGISRHIHGLTIASIEKDALEYARLEWVKYYGPTTHTGFQESWERLYHRYLPRPSFFDVAIWQDVNGARVLQAMALGRPSNGKNQLNINWVERSFAPTYLRCGALLPILACAEEYAKLLGSRRVVVKDAVDPSVYQRYGYDLVRLPYGAGIHPVKEL